MGDMSREPSMEEILSSIRRVIARDEPVLVGGGPADDSAVADGVASLSGQGGQVRANAARQLTPMHEGGGVADDDDDDVLELTDAEPPSIADADQTAPAADQTAAAQPASPEPVIASFPMPSPSTPPSSQGTPAAQQASAALVSQVSVAASRQSLDALAAALAGGGPAPKPSTADAAAGDLTVNALVEAAVRPMLKEWLDTHLPPMVERLVAREIARITGNRL